MLERLKAFSLLELIITIALMFLLLFFVFPFGRSFFDRNVLDSRAKMLKDAIGYSQNQALTLNKPVVLAPISTDNWSKGMRLFINSQADHRYKPGDKVLREWHWRGNKLSLSWEGFLSDSYLFFSDRLTQSVLNGRFILKNRHGHLSRELIVNSLGRVRTE